MKNTVLEVATLKTASIDKGNAKKEPLRSVSIIFDDDTAVPRVIWQGEWGGAMVKRICNYIPKAYRIRRRDLIRAKVGQNQEVKK